MRIALASAELYPLGGGGIGQFASAAARLLAEVAEVTVLTKSTNRPEYERLAAEGDPRLPPPAVRVAFVAAASPDPEECEGFFSPAHLYSARVWERLRELYPDGGPELIEFPDFLGEGCVTAQAAATLDPFLRRTLVCVRTHTAAEICEVLDGAEPRDFPTRATFGLERLALREADRLIWQGGDIAGTYRRYYGADRLAPMRRIRYPYHGPRAEPEGDRGFRAGEPLRLLYAGRLERRKGVANLLRAASELDRDDFRLTLIGADTPTAPLGVSMRDHLLLAAADDERIELAEPLSRAELAEEVRAHDAVLLPSLWECWPYAALEALHLNRPLLATPVGGLAEMVVPGRSGWRSRGTDPGALAEALEGLLESRGELEAMVREGRPAEVARSLADERQITDAYRSLAAEPRRERRAPPSPPPLVSAVIPYHASAEFVGETISSLRAQTYPRLEIILINDGSFEETDWVLAELAARHPIEVITQPNYGLGAARNFGIAQSRGRYVFPLDADNAAEPTFVARCVEVLESRPELAYVTSWSHYVDERGREPPGDRGFQPLGAGTSPEANREHNIAGDAAALLRRRVFDLGFAYSEELTSYEDWHLYRELERAGHRGAVIPERLIRYRVHAGQMTRQVALKHRLRIEAEIEAHVIEGRMRWAVPAGSDR
jgi:glycosyltransferase involved in cell wall biosynthesis